MPQITYIEHDGTEHRVEVADGVSVMKGAANNGILGITAECGGACACATCHVYVDSAWTDKVSPLSDMEDAMLEVVEHREPTSRLSCQLTVNDALNGLVVRIPESQG